MDIILTSMSLSKAQLSNQTGILVMKKVLDTTEQQGQAMQVMLASAGVDPNLGQNIDIRI